MVERAQLAKTLQQCVRALEMVEPQIRGAIPASDVRHALEEARRVLDELATEHQRQEEAAETAAHYPEAAQEPQTAQEPRELVPDMWYCPNNACGIGGMLIEHAAHRSSSGTFHCPQCGAQLKRLHEAQEPQETYAHWREPWEPAQEIRGSALLEELSQRLQEAWAPASGPALLCPGCNGRRELSGLLPCAVCGRRYCLMCGSVELETLAGEAYTVEEERYTFYCFGCRQPSHMSGTLWAAILKKWPAQPVTRREEH